MDAGRGVSLHQGLIGAKPVEVLRADDRIGVLHTGIQDAARDARPATDHATPASGNPMPAAIRGRGAPVQGRSAVAASTTT